MNYGPCDDDYEATCIYVGMLPDESYKEDGSPLHFDSLMEPTNRIGDNEEPQEDEAFYAHIFDD